MNRVIAEFIRRKIAEIYETDVTVGTNNDGYWAWWLEDGTGRRINYHEYTKKFGYIKMFESSMLRHNQLKDLLSSIMTMERLAE